MLKQVVGLQYKYLFMLKQVVGLQYKYLYTMSMAGEEEVDYFQIVAPRLIFL